MEPRDDDWFTIVSEIEAYYEAWVKNALGK